MNEAFRPPDFRRYVCKTARRAILCWRMPLLATAMAILTGPAPADEPPAQAHYTGYVLGLHVFDMTLAVSLQSTAYEVDASFRLAGALGAFFHADGSTSVHGQFIAGRVVPQEMISEGHYSGESHILRMNWTDGVPKVVQMDPPLEKDREPVSKVDKANTVDTLSAVAALVQHVAQAGRCDATARTYDGARLTELSAQTAGQELLKPTDRSSFHGNALRCDLTVRMTGGFMSGEDNAEARRPKLATVWFASIQRGGPPLPVRMAFHSEGSPAATVYLR